MKKPRRWASSGVFDLHGVTAVLGVPIIPFTPSKLWHDAWVIVPIPPVVPPGRMSHADQPVFGLASGLELRPWSSDDAKVLADSCQDLDV